MMLAIDATPAIVEKAVRPMQDRWTGFLNALNADMVLVEQTETGLALWSKAKMEKPAEWIVKQLQQRNTTGFQFITIHKTAPAYKIGDFGRNQRAIVNGTDCTVNVRPISGDKARLECSPWEGGMSFTEIRTLDNELTIA
jgi:hypothetical protein